LTDTAPTAVLARTPTPTRPGAVPYSAAGPTFGGILASLTHGGSLLGPDRFGAPSPAASSATRQHHHHAAGAQYHRRTAGAGGGAGSAKASPGDLQQAMQRENVPSSWQDHLQFIMSKESGGNVGAASPYHSARGLFQLTAANYHFNPNGARSFGDAVEEAQGGIRYIKDRYGTAENAVQFWQQHHWY